MCPIGDMLKTMMVPIHREGYGMVTMLTIIVSLLSVIFPRICFPAVAVVVLCLYFFRDPDRVTPDDPEVILAPADGRVDKIEIANPPEELELGSSGEWTRISIFLSIFNVHVQRVPFGGKIVKLLYRDGAFLNIYSDKNSKDNERQCCVLETKEGLRIPFVQIAGLIARRIVCNLTVGQEVTRGDRYGIIRFGSRVDLYLPKEIKVCVKVGQTMIAGESVIARI
ncbi:MAG: phosphatidylserine decarboxylase [Rickettsiales bacterium]|jgi:phosphatidylserine decarboxylase|nr:phosphatidylserine decarboxylase [Rickettsiales bacterium]